MRFTLIDPTDPDREFAIVIDISKHDYSSTLGPLCLPSHWGVIRTDIGRSSPEMLPASAQSIRNPA